MTRHLPAELPAPAVEAAYHHRSGSDQGVPSPRASWPLAWRFGAVLAVAGAVVLAGCTASADTSTSPATSAGAPNGGSETAADAGAFSSAKRSTAMSAEVASRPGASDLGKLSRPISPGTVKPGSTLLAKKASIDLEVGDMAESAGRVRAIVAAQQGTIVTESLGSSGRGKGPTTSAEDEPFGGYGTLTISVPSTVVDATLTELAKVGTVLARGSSSTDVTSEYVDTESRIKTLRASVDRVRALMSQAQSVGQVVTLESELSQRQADLESLESQLAALEGRVDSATITVSLATPSRVNAAKTGGGFTGGLKDGWHAFLSSGRDLLTGVASVLPFILFVALIGVPLVLWLRRRLGGLPRLRATTRPDAPQVS